MILLDNYSEMGTYIRLEKKGYSVVRKDLVVGEKKGIGGFSEDEELLGLYFFDNRLFFQYKDKAYEVNANELSCSNSVSNDGNRCFNVRIGKCIVCDITYKPFISPFSLAFEEEDDEFDFLLYISRIMKNEETINTFIRGIQNTSTNT